jgi:predicted amidophosphoribosyltransferase
MSQAYFDEEGPTEHDAHLLGDEHENDLVPCPACGKTILALADRCHRCGSVFDREAWLVQTSPKKGLYLWTAVGLLIVIAWTLVAAW